MASLLTAVFKATVGLLVMRFRDIRQHSNKEEPQVTVEEDEFGNITVTVSRGEDSATAFNVAPGKVKHIIQKLTKKV